MRRGMLSETQREKKKTKGRRHKTQHAKKKKKRTCARSFSTGEENMMGQKERYVLRITHATHFCYASTGPLLLPFETCRRPTTRTSQGMTHLTPPTTHREQTHAHARQPHRARPPPPRHPHQHEGPHSAHTHTRAKGKGTQTPMILAAVFPQNSKSCIFSTAISNCTQQYCCFCVFSKF